MTLFAGVDGGQSSTVAVVADESGSILGRGNAGPADDVGEPRGAVRTAEAIDAAILAALASAALPSDAEFRAVVAGVSGYDASKEGASAPLRTRAERVLIEHDAASAHRGAFANEPGILVIAGTGSAAHGLGVNGAVVLVGGWGYLFGDEGSAFWLSRRAISAAMRAEDHGAQIELGNAALRHFGLGSLRHIQHSFAAGSITRPLIAAFAHTVCEIAHKGDEEAVRARDEASVALAALAEVAHVRLGHASVGEFSYHGGLFRDPAVHERWTLEIVERIPDARVVAPRYDPPVGALLRAYERSMLGGRLPTPRELPAE
jgi:N-acetylglucosamine kinase-like BadF-type ATPase